MDEAFARNISLVFFFYGLAFYSMGLAVLLEISHSSELDFAKALKPLGLFGLVHGAHEWFEMWLILHTMLTGVQEAEWVYYLRLILLAISFLLLIAFGIRLILGPEKRRIKFLLMVIIILLWYLGLFLVLSQPLPTREQLIAADVYTRYSLAIPGAALAAWGLMMQGQTLKKSGMRRFSIDVSIAAIAFALYGGIGQLFVTPTNVFPSSYINSTLFLNIFGFPIQTFRAAMAIVAAIFIVHSLRVFDEEKRRRIQELSEAQKADGKRLKDLRSELLLRTVNAQELERKRIARELHDDTGQTLTALGLGLHGMAETIPKNPQKAVEQAGQLQLLATDGISNLQRMVSGLHPPQLDELGLLAALRGYAREISQLHNIRILVSGFVDEHNLRDEIRLTIFRITQEAITNTVRHSIANKVLVNLKEEAQVIYLSIEDNGQGFDVNHVLDGNTKNCLGLLGMIERATLLGGECSINSQIGVGTKIEVRLFSEKSP
jgi:signal transduction histidine kinase